MYDEILGPIVNPRSKATSAQRNIIVSPTGDKYAHRDTRDRDRSHATSSSLGNYGENLLNSNSGLFKQQPSSFSSSSSSSTVNWDGKFADIKEDGSGKSLSPRASSLSASSSSASPRAGAGADFNSSILARLTSVENHSRSLQRQLNEKTEQAERLEAENARLRRALEAEGEVLAKEASNVTFDANGDVAGRVGGVTPPRSYSTSLHSGANTSVGSNTATAHLLKQLQELRDDNIELENQVVEMEQFLADYGLEWVGQSVGPPRGGSGGDANCSQNRAESKKEEGNCSSNSTKKTSSAFYTLDGSERKQGSPAEAKTRTAAATDNRSDFRDYKTNGILSGSNTTSGDGSDSGTRSSSNIYHVDYHDFHKKVQELNDMINSEPAQVRKEKHNARQARLMQPCEFTESIPLTFYSNGIMIRRGPFRPSDSASYKAFCRDIMDGYFPSDFRKEHPDGVLFCLTDKHRESYNGTVQRTLVSGSLNPEDSTNAQAYSREEILNKLPTQKVLQNGDVVDIRAGIASRLTKEKAGNSRSGFGQNTNEIVSRLSNDRVEDTGLDDEMCEDSDASSECDKNDRPPTYQLSGLLQSTKRIAAMSQQLPLPVSSEDTSTNSPAKGKAQNDSSTTAISAVVGSGANQIVIISTPASQSTSPSSAKKKTDGTALIRIKWLDGRMLHMKLWDTDLVGDVREHIRRYLYNMSCDDNISGNSGKIEDGDNFELRGTYPPRPLPDSMTLVEAGLVPNGTVHAKKNM